MSMLTDLPVEVRISKTQIIGQGYRSYEKYEISLSGSAAMTRVERDVLRSGLVVGILPVDIVRDEVVLIRQFRLGSHIAFGRGAMIEVPAGRVAPQESAHDAACRECHEEIGARPKQLHAVFEIMPAPALSDESMVLYAALIDAAEVKTRAGCVEEQEDIEPMRVSFDAAAAMLARGGFHNSTAIIALQWLALNREKLPDIFGQGPGRAGA
ncbi:MAG: putative MutT/ADP-ribose pyrophosphatase [Bradyrhizobium sp.]|jgi:ADP-ribose pyrophosphatase|nr:putative MutT/ADP-ribose pyrophosphatase [Bradyrhizobium sp.]